MSAKPNPASHLPLHPLNFRVLVALRDAPLHGYRIVKELEQRDAGQIHPANLYRRIRDLKKDGLIAETEPPEAPADERDRKFFALTSFGRQVLAAEIQRLQALLIEAGAAPTASQE